MTRLIWLCACLFAFPLFAELEPGHQAASSQGRDLYKIVTKEQWRESQKLGYVQPGPDDTAFIHLAKKDQVQKVLEKFYWPTESRAYVLTLNASKLVGKVIQEKNPGSSTLYPHLYEGSIPLSAVRDIQMLQPQDRFGTQ